MAALQGEVAELHKQLQLSEQRLAAEATVHQQSKQLMRQLVEKMTALQGR